MMLRLAVNKNKNKNENLEFNLERKEEGHERKNRTDDDRIEAFKRLYGDEAFREIQREVDQEGDGYKRRRRDDIVDSSPLLTALVALAVLQIQGRR